MANRDGNLPDWTTDPSRTSLTWDDTPEESPEGEEEQAEAEVRRLLDLESPEYLRTLGAFRWRDGRSRAWFTTTENPFWFSHSALAN